MEWVVASREDFNLVVVAQAWVEVCQTLGEWETWEEWEVVKARGWNSIQMNYLR